MSLAEILRILESRLITLNEAKKNAIATGDLDAVNRIDADILTTGASIEELKKLV